MTHEVTFTPKAEFEVFCNAEWWSQHRSLDQAQEWLRAVRTTKNALTHDPERWPVAAESDEMPIVLREILFGIGRRKTHRMVFEVLENSVLVHTVRHLAQDRLSPDDIL